MSKVKASYKYVMTERGSFYFINFYFIVFIMLPLLMPLLLPKIPFPIHYLPI